MNWYHSTWEVRMVSREVVKATPGLRPASPAQPWIICDQEPKESESEREHGAA